MVKNREIFSVQQSVSSNSLKFFLSNSLKTFNKLLLLLEDILQLPKSGLHLFERELVLSLCGLVLGHPGVQFCDSVVQEDPFLDKDVTLLDPGIRYSLDCIKSGLKTSNFSIGFSMCGHLVCSTLGRGENLQVVDTVLVESKNLVIQGLDFSKIRGLGETFSCSLFSTNQPRSEFLDTSSVLSPELDIIGVLVTLNLGVGLELCHVLGDPGKLILEDLSISRDLVSLREEGLLCCCALLENLELGCNIFLEIHGSCNSILREHSSRSFLDVCEFSCCSIFPRINCLKGVVKSSQVSNKIFNLLDCGGKTSIDLKLVLNSCNFLCKSFLLVLRNGDGHGSHIGIDGIKESIDSVGALLKKVLSLLEISIGCLKVEHFLDLLDFLFGNFKFWSNCFIVFSIANESILGLIEELKSVLCLLLGVIPTLFNPLDISFKELWLVWVLQDNLALGNKVCDNALLGIKLRERLLLPLNQFVNILNAGRSNVSGGGQHDSIKELNMRFQLITIGITLPVQVNHD